MTLISDSFLCVDRLADENNQFKYLLHITDMAQEESHVRLPVKSSIEGQQNFSFDRNEG